MFRSVNVYKPLLWCIVSACATLLILYCHSIIFTRLLNKDFTSIKKNLDLKSFSSGVAYSHICK